MEEPKTGLRDLHQMLAKYRPWSERAAWLQMVTAIAALTFVATFHGALLSPDLFAESKLAEAPDWIKPIYRGIARIWHPAIVWTTVAVAAVNLIKGIVDISLQSTKK